MNYLFVILVFLILNFIVSYLLKIKIQKILPVTNFIIIIVLYLCGVIFSNLFIGIMIIAISCCYAIYKFFILEKHDKQVMKKLYTSTGVLYFFIIITFAITFSSKMKFVNWDEFSHWGLVVKNMYALDKFGNVAEATTLFKGYPPAMALFQYFMVVCFGEFNEGIIYSSNIYFQLSLFSFLVKSRNKITNSIISFTFVVLSLIFISLGAYTSIYVDLTLGTLSAYILCYGLNGKKYDSKKIITLSTALFVLSLVKATGFSLGIMISIILFCDIVIIKEIKLKIGYLILSSIIGKYSWDFYTKIMSNFTGAWRGISNFTFSKFCDFWINNKGIPYQFETKKNFINQLSQEIYTINIGDSLIKLSFIKWVLIFVIIGIILCAFEKNIERKRKLNVIAGLFIIGIIYTISLLNLYVFTFSEYEAIRLASFSRYLETFIMFNFIVLCCLIFEKVYRIRINKQIKVILYIFILGSTFYNFKKLVNVYHIKRERTIQISKKWIEGIEANSKIYFIAQNTNGYEYWIARYELTPYHLNQGFGSWSIGQKYNEGDIWTLQYTDDNFKNELKKYNYIYFYKIDDKFLKEFESLFKNYNIKNNEIYKINIIKNEIELKIIGE